MIYNLIFYAGFASNLSTYGRFAARRYMYYGAIPMILLFVCLRWNIGCDFGSYLRHAEDFGQMPWADALYMPEPGYWLLVVALNRLGLEFPAINIVAALVFFVGIWRYSKDEPDPLTFVMLIFPLLILNIPMSAIRQAMSMGLLCFALVAFQDRSLWRYVLYVVVAAQFHQSAIAFLALAPLLISNRTAIQIAIGVPAAVAVVYFLATSDTAASYTEAYVDSGVDAAGGAARVAIVAATGLGFIMFLRPRWKYFFPRDYQLVFYFSLIMIACAPLVYYSSVLGDRFSYYTMPVAYMVQSKAYLMFAGPRRTLLYVLPFVVSGLALLAWSQLSWIFAVCYVPYKTWI